MGSAAYAHHAVRLSLYGHHGLLDFYHRQSAYATLGPKGKVVVSCLDDPAGAYEQVALLTCVHAVILP